MDVFSIHKRPDQNFYVTLSILNWSFECVIIEFDKDCVVEGQMNRFLEADKA